MIFDLFINFNGNCREALEFYSNVFKSEIKDLMTYSSSPTSEDYVVPEADKDRIMYSCIPIFGCNVMFCDIPSGENLIAGNNISLTISTADANEIKRIFSELKEGGKIYMPLGSTFWSDLFGMVQDKYGICWQMSHIQ